MADTAVEDDAISVMVAHGLALIDCRASYSSRCRRLATRPRCARRWRRRQRAQRGRRCVLISRWLTRLRRRTQRRWTWRAAGTVRIWSRACSRTRPSTWPKSCLCHRLSPHARVRHRQRSCGTFVSAAQVLWSRSCSPTPQRIQWHCNRYASFRICSWH